MMSFVRVARRVSRPAGRTCRVSALTNVSFCEFSRKTVRILNRSNSIFGKRFGCSIEVIQQSENTVITTICVRARALHFQEHKSTWNSASSQPINEEHTILGNPRREIEVNPNAPLNTIVQFGLSKGERRPGSHGTSARLLSSAQVSQVLGTSITAGALGTPSSSTCTWLIFFSIISSVILAFFEPRWAEPE